VATPVFNIQELSIFKYEQSGGRRRKASNPASSGGGIVAAVVPGSVDGPEFVSLTDEFESNFLSWGFTLKVVCLASSVIAVEEIQVKVKAGRGLVAESFRPGSTRRLVSQSDRKTKPVEPYPLILKPQKEQFLKVELILSAYRKAIGLSQPYYISDREFEESRLFKSFRSSAEITIVTNEGKVQIKL
jgi:hypothetical protein